MTAWGDWRVGDAERDAVAAELGDHYAAGRLTLEELNSRIDAAYGATTAGDLARVTADLPAAARAGLRPGDTRAGWDRRRRGGRIRSTMLLALAVFIAVSVLAAYALPHGGLLVVLFLLFALPLLMVAGLAAALIWIGRRAWRRSLWLEAVPLAMGMPWLGRAVWAARACAVGRAYWRAGGRAHRGMRRGYARSRSGGYDRAGGLSGTTR
jgi:hypothetical protein